MSFLIPPHELYTTEQINNYLSRIKLPKDLWPTLNPTSLKSESALESLTKLTHHHLTSVPFKNLSLHYASIPGVSINKEDIYQKIVVNRRGGYCMEVNYLFATVLRTLGYEVVSLGAWVCMGGVQAGFGHTVNLVTVAEKGYIVDVGFGSKCPTRPLPLVNGLVSKWGATNSEMRLQYTKPSNPMVQGVWLYQHRKSPESDWTPMYSFTLTEFFPPDFERMNFAVSTKRASMFTQRIICTRFCPDDENGDIEGRVVLADTKWSLRKKDGVLLEGECAGEAQRIDVLKRWFDVELSTQEQAGIKGTVCELKG